MSVYEWSLERALLACESVNNFLSAKYLIATAGLAMR
jgi:hypothetical protein